MGFEYLFPLKKRIFGNGSVSYSADGSLSFDFSIWKKNYRVIVCIQNKVSGVTQLLVRSDEKSIVLCYSDGFLVIDTSNMLFNVMQMGDTTKPLFLPEEIIPFHGNARGCCFNPQDNRLMHVLDSSYNFYSFDTEDYFNPVRKMWRLSDIVPVKDIFHILVSTPVFIDILTERKDNLFSLFIVMQNGSSIFISHLSANHLLLKSSHSLPQSMEKPSIQLSQNECKNVRLVGKLEETSDFILYCGVSLETIYLIVNYHQDHRAQVLENHVFDLPIPQEDVKVDVYNREIIVNDTHLSYQWVFDLVSGKEMWSKRDEKELSVEKLDNDSSLDHQYDWWMCQSEMEIREAIGLLQSTKKELNDKFNVLNSVDVLDCTLTMLE